MFHCSSVSSSSAEFAVGQRETFTGVVDVMQVFIGSNNAFRRGLALGTMN